MDDMHSRAEHVARETDTSIQHAAMLLSDSDNRAKWRKLESEINDLVEVVEDGGD